MRRKLIIGCILFILSFIAMLSPIAIAAEISDPGLVHVSRYGSTYPVQGVATGSVRTMDGGIAIATISQSGGGGLTKYGSDGNLEWSQHYGITRPWSLIQARDGGYAIAFSTGGYGRHLATIAKTDASGGILWEESFNGSFESGDIDAYGYCVGQTSDNGFILSGELVLNSSDLKLYLVKVDDTGHKQWERLYNFSDQYWFTQMVSTSDGGFLVIGDKNNGNGMTFVKISQDGDLIWQNSLDTGGISSKVIPVNNGFLISVPPGSGSGQFTLFRVDEGGTVLWSKTIGGVMPMGCGGSITYEDHTSSGLWSSMNVLQGDNGYYLLAEETTGDRLPGIIKLDADGTVQWFKAIGSTPTIYGYMIISAGNGNYRLVVYEDGMQYIDVFREADPGIIVLQNSEIYANYNQEVVAITLLRRGGADGNVSVNYSTRDDSAISGLDYLPVNGEVTFGDNETTKSLMLTLLHRNLTSTNLIFSLALENVNGGAKLGSPNVTTITMSYKVTQIPTPTIVIPAVSSWGNGTGNNTGIIQYPSVEKAASTVVVVATSVSIALIWPWLGRLLDFILGGLKTYLQGQYSALDKRIRKTTANERMPFLFGLSSQEILVGLVSAVLLGAAVAYAKGQLFIIQMFILLIFIAGFTAVIHEIAHRYFAYRYGVMTEYKFWDAGAVTLIITALLYQPFATPARTIIDEKGNPDKRIKGIVSLVGPVASIVVAIGFLLLIIFDNGLGQIGKDGFKLCMMACVYQLMPVNPLEGVKVLNWNKWIWAIVFVPALIFYLGMLLFVL